MNDKHTVKKKWVLALCMVMWGTLGPFTRQITISSGELALYRAVLAVIFIVFYLTISKQKFDFRLIKREILLLFLSGMAMGFNWVLLFEAYKYTTISMATLSYYFAPVIVMIACPILFRERLTRKQIFCFVMSTVGLIMIIGVGTESSAGTDAIGIFCGLGAACLYAIVILMNKYIKEVTGIFRTFMQFMGAIAILSCYVACTDGINLNMLNETGWICLLIVGLVHTGIIYCLYFSAIKELDGQSVAILSYIDPLVAVMISFFVLGESLIVLQVIGGTMILGFTLYNEKT